MNLRPRAAACAAARLGLLAAVACGAPGAAPTSAAPERAEPAPRPNPSALRVEVRAPIVRVAVRVAESQPPQYFADVTSALPDGCAQFSRAALRRADPTLYVDVFNTRPARDDIACTMIYGEHETSVALGSDFRPGARYTLDVNGTLETFVAQ